MLLCLDEQSAVLLETGDGSQGGIGPFDLDWAGVRYSASDGGNPVTMTTPVLQPGCGFLVFGVACCRIPNYLAVRATKV